MAIREWRYEWIDGLEAWGDERKLLSSACCFVANLAAFFLRGLMLQMLLSRGLPILGAESVSVSLPLAAISVLLMGGVVYGAPDQFKPTPIYSATAGLIAAVFNLAFLWVVLWAFA